ncbi:hypothetical protein [Pseudoxanthomonas sp. UC19_8]|uniref:hypothetical protein n=1 Tax=Pseudoxanthomonas sp. UC19_8 TaxID=3350175 RepID=UPI0036D33D5A
MRIDEEELRAQIPQCVLRAPGQEQSRAVRSAQDDLAGAIAQRDGTDLVAWKRGVAQVAQQRLALVEVELRLVCGRVHVPAVHRHVVGESGQQEQARGARQAKERAACQQLQQRRGDGGELEAAQQSRADLEHRPRIGPPRYPAHQTIPRFSGASPLESAPAAATLARDVRIGSGSRDRPIAGASTATVG